jgi:hypothetical protein
LADKFDANQQAAGTAIPSYTSKLLDSSDPERILTAEEEHDIKWSASSLYGAGVDTVRATMNHLSVSLQSVTLSLHSSLVGTDICNCLHVLQSDGSVPRGTG